MHLLRGETLAYNYIQMIADAVFTVERDLKTMSAADASKGEKCRRNLKIAHVMS